MPRYRLDIEYHGGPFVGWQRQQNGPSVQAALERALAAIGETAPAMVGAGRTDAGVHALCQVAHVDLTRHWAPGRLAMALCHHLKPDPVAVHRATPVADGFHARFSALERRYLYRIICRHAPLTQDKGRAWRRAAALDVGAMRRAARVLSGTHDFTTFRHIRCQANSPVRTLDEIHIEEQARPHEFELRLHFRARSFLHSQVRSLVGALERVGAGAWTVERVAAALEARDRTACAPVAPARGLYLADVRYDEELATRFSEPRRSERMSG